MPERVATTIALRGSLGIIVMVVTSLFALVLLIDAVVRGAWWLAFQGAVTLALVLWLEWLLLVSPSLVVTSKGLVVVSPLYRRAIDWDDVSVIEPRFVPTIVLQTGTRIRVFGAPTAGVDRAVGAGDLDVPANQPTSVLVASARRILAGAAEPPRAYAVSGWRWADLAVTVALVIATVLVLR